MRKQVKLTSKKNTPKPKKESFFFFVKDQGEGAAKIIVIILKILELILTTIYGLVMGIFAPLIIRNSDLIDPEVSQSSALIFWIIASILYIIGMFTLMLGCSKIASGIHLAALVGTLISNQIFLEIFKEFQDGNSLTGMYMPCVFITVITLTVMLLINIPKAVEQHVQKENEAAPSIFDSPKIRGKNTNDRHK